MEFNRPMDKSNINQLIQEAINPILHVIDNYFNQSGYSYLTFNNLEENNVDIVNLTYNINLQINKSIAKSLIKKIKKKTGCISSIFNIETDSIQSQKSKGQLRYKRISYFNKMSSIFAYITKMLKKS